MVLAVAGAGVGAASATGFGEVGEENGGAGVAVGAEVRFLRPLAGSCCFDGCEKVRLTKTFLLLIISIVKCSCHGYIGKYWRSG